MKAARIEVPAPICTGSQDSETVCLLYAQHGKVNEYNWELGSIREMKDWNLQFYTFQNKKGSLISFYVFVLYSAAGTRGNFLKEVLEISSKEVCKCCSYEYWIELQGIYIVNKERQHKIPIIKEPGVLKYILNIRLLDVAEFLNNKLGAEVGIYIICVSGNFLWPNSKIQCSRS